MESRSHSSLEAEQGMCVAVGDYERLIERVRQEAQARGVLFLEGAVAPLYLSEEAEREQMALLKELDAEHRQACEADV